MNKMHLLATNPAIADEIAAELIADYAAAGLPLSQFEGNFVGLKCDTPACGWEDMTIPFEEYEANVGRPCPNCGASILTPEDFATAKGFNVLMESVRKQLPQGDEGEGEGVVMRVVSDTKGGFTLKNPIEIEKSSPESSTT